MYFVLRGPSFQEDEGRSEYHGSFGSKEEAEAHIDKIVKESKGWYSHGSFTIARAERSF